MFSENTEKSDEQSLNSLMSTSPTVLDDSETSILRSLPTDANMTITTSDNEESATRSVETLPAGNLVDPAVVGLVDYPDSVWLNLPRFAGSVDCSLCHWQYVCRVADDH